MKLAVMVVVILAAACGDNSDQCGSGTTAVDHVCVPAATCGSGTTTDVNGTCVPDGTVVCGAGTTFDPVLGTCVVDSSVCQDGTVLINGMCVDPNKGLVVDVEEGPEPNGLGFFEASTNPAGIVSALKPVGGSGLVIHGHIDPFQDADHDGLLDPDVDTYLVEVAAPTLVHLTAAGSSSVTAGFYVAPNVSSGPLQNWRRVGMNLGGNTSKRQLYLPAAGEYVLAIADSRTLYQLATTQGPAAGAPGGPDGDYYITLDALDTPEPTLLAVTNSAASDASTIGPEETKFYTVPMGIGLNAVTVDMPAQAALSSVAVFKNGAYQETATESDDPFLGETPANLVVGGYQGADLSTIVVEPAYNIALAPVPYTLSVNVADATSMPIGGVTPVVVTELANQPSQIAADLAHYNQFYFDIHNNPDQTIGLSITWTQPVRGQIFDENGDLAVEFVDTSDTADTWTAFSGLARLHDAGRYYFVVYDPAGVPGTSSLGALCMVRTLSTLVLEDISDTSDLPATFPPASPTEAVFSYDPGTAPWQTFDSTGDETGGQNVVLLDAATAFGRLDALVLDGGAIVDPAQNELLAHTYPETGQPIGHILLDDHVTTYLVKVSLVAPGDDRTFSLTFAPRTFTDLGTLAGSPVTSANHALDATNQPAYFLYRSATSSTPTTTVHPQVPASLDTQFQIVDGNEQAIGGLVDTTASGDDTTMFQSFSGWTAFVVTAVTPPADTELFDVTVSP